MKKILAVVLCIAFLVAYSSVFAASDYTATWVTINKTGITTVDTLDKVPALYKTGNTDSGTYCCAQYAKNYYKQVYGVTLSGLGTNGTPALEEKAYKMVVTKSPKKGDLAFWSSRPHSAIVKSVSGDSVTLIEQNFKWNDKGVEKGAKNRTLKKSNSGLTFYTLVKK